MSKVTEFISLLKAQWAQPREAIHRGETCPFLLACSFSTETADKLDPLPISLPEDVREFWRATRSATLFKDMQYGQWGIEILEPGQALAITSRQTAERPRDFTITDLVLARFLGDSDLLVISCDPNRPDFGSVTIALPLDKRDNWPVVAESFGDFLQRLIEAQGDKYWETQATR
jgi:hypothetical protein